jgi:hypothetical protein
VWTVFSFSRFSTPPEGPAFGALQTLGKAFDRDADSSANGEEEGK